MNRLGFNQKGSVFILMAFTIPLLIAFSAIAVDVGYLYVQRSHLQNIADAAALAGAAKLGVSNDTAKDLAETYIEKNSNPSDAATTNTITFSEENNTQQIRVNIAKAAPLLFMKYFNFNTVDLAVYAIASYSGSSSSIFDNLIISGSENSVINLGNGGGYTFTGNIHSNYKISTGGGGRTIDGNVSASANEVWVGQSDNYHVTGTITANSPLIDISVKNSGLSSLIEKIKQKNTFNGDYPNGANFSDFGDGIYINGNFKQSWLSGSNATTVIIATGDIYIGSLHYIHQSSANHVLFCSLHGDIYFGANNQNYNAIFYAPEGKVEVQIGDARIKGSVIGKTVIVDNGNFEHNSFGFGGSGGGATKVRLIE